MTEKLYESVRSSAVLFERDAGLARVSGPDRGSWLQGMVSNDVARLQPGEGCYAAHLTPQGKVLSLMIVLAAEDAFWLLLDQDVRRSVEALDKLLIMEDAAIEDCSKQFRVLSVVGASARALVESWAGDLKSSGLYGHSAVGESRVLCSDLGYDLIVPRQDAKAIEATLIQAGAARGSHALWNVLTVEAGVPRYGIDVDDSTTLPELGEKGIDYEKGCYTGQEVVAKIKYIGHVNRNFVGLRLEGSTLPEQGASVHGNGKEVGRVTRAARSPALGAGIALAYVKRGNAEPGTAVEVATGGETVSATVSALPFVSHAAR